MNPLEFPKVNLSYIDKESGDEFFAECKEIGATRLIPKVRCRGRCVRRRTGHNQRTCGAVPYPGRGPAG